uniref:Restin n=1 Tax=Anthurium amnicola TaxID=1678845 RepID=A0A1D1ZJT0_9ARAE
MQLRVIRQEQTPDESPASTIAGEANGIMQILDDLGDPPDTLSGDTGRWPCLPSGQDADSLGMDQCNSSIGNDGENSEVGTSENGREHATNVIPFVVKENVPGPAKPRLKGNEEEDALPLPAEEIDNVDGGVSTSERVAADIINEDTVAIIYQGIVTEQDGIQFPVMENQRDTQSFAPVNDIEKTNKDADACVKPGFDEARVACAVQLPAENVYQVVIPPVHGERTSDECVDSKSAAQDFTKIEKEGTIIQADIEGVERFVGEETEKKDLSKLSTVLASEKMGDHVIENPTSVREDVESFLSGEKISLMKSKSSFPTSCAQNVEDAMEVLKRHLYLTSVKKDFLLLQITELDDKQVESDHKLPDEVSRLWDLVRETQEKTAAIHEELGQCRTDLQAMFSEKKDFEIQCLSARGKIEELSAMVLELQNELELSQKESTELSAELVDCKSVVGALQIENSKLTVQILSGTDEIQKLKAERGQSTMDIKELSARICDLQTELKLSKKESTKLSAELADCEGLVMALQVENSYLMMQILSGTEDISKLKAEKDFFASENMKLASALSEQKDQLALALDKMVQLEGDFKETMFSVENLTEENIDLISYLDLHKSKVKELDNDFQELLSQAQRLGNHAKNSIFDSMVSNNAIGDSHRNHGNVGEVVLDKVDKLLDPCIRQRPSLQVEENDPDEPAVLFVLTGHLVEAEKMLLNLEKAILGMCTHHMSLGKAGGRAANKGVSKLIQAFESKVHQDNVPSDEVALVEGEKLADSDSYNIAKQLVCNLRAVLKQMVLDTETAEVLCKKEQDSLHIVMKLKVECETLTLQNNKLQRTIDALGMKLTDYELNVDNLQNQLDTAWQNADEMAGTFLNQVESLQKEVNGMANNLEKEMNIMKDVISGSTEKLDAYTGLLLGSELDSGSHLTASTNAATKMIEDLQEKLEAASLNYDRSRASYDELCRNYTCLSERQESTSLILYRIHSSFTKLIKGYEEKPELDACNNSMDANAEQLHLEDFEVLIEQLSELLKERLALHSVKGELESKLALRNCNTEELKERCAMLAKKLEENNSTIDEVRSLLMRRDQDFDELNRGCLALAQKFENLEMNECQIVLPGLVENLKVSLKSENMEINSVKQLLLHLGTLVTSLIQKYSEAMEQLDLSKNCLHEALLNSECLVDSHSEPLYTFIKQDIIPRIVELLGKREKVNWLSSKNVQQEIEMQILKESLSKVEEALENAHFEINSKVTELEQSEQKVSSVREKLSIAVAKGKGLVVQRDSLKQSLKEKSSELERCFQELRSKEAKLCDLETKLKSSEADRVEALESELSYIRNSATAFRDSFLQKDSVLQKIEEVVEDLDLPEAFHSKDVVEKIEWLAKSVTLNGSFPNADWEQKSSLGVSQIDPGYVDMDAWTGGLQAVSSSGLDDLKRKYDELQSRFYGLAEQNDMLDQSLMETNGLVKRWEKVLGSIDMPIHLRSMEPEDRLQWLGRRLLEVQQERDSLLTKIDNLEISTSSLLSDLEGSREKISDLDAALITIRRENDFLSENLSKLRSEHLEVSDKAALNELEKDRLQKEIAGLQERLAEIFECQACGEIMIEVKKLHDLVCEALPDDDKPDISSSDSSVTCLERSLRKLIDNYKAFPLEKHMAPHDSSGIHSDMVLEEQNPKEQLDDKVHSPMMLNVELDEVYRDLAIAKEERDRMIEKYHMQISEMETLMRQRDTLLEERDSALQKYQSLVSELDAISNQRDSLQHQLSQEEQRSASTREKLNVAVRKGKGLVQQRDSLKQTVEEMNAEFNRLKKELNQHVETLQSENNLLRNTLAESGNTLHDLSQTLNRLLTALYSIDLGAESNIVDPVQKMEWIGRVSHDLRAAVLSSENEATKSKRAAELLVAELNEVQERADSLQEDLGKIESTLAQCSRDREIAEAERSTAVSHLEQFMIARNMEKKKQLGFIIEVKGGIYELRKGLLSLSNMLATVLPRDSALFCSVKASVESIMKVVDGTNPGDVSFLAPAVLLSNDLLSEDTSFSAGGFSELDISEEVDDGLITEYAQVTVHGLHECTRELADIKEKLHKHSFAVDQQVKDLYQMTQSRIASRDLSSESLKSDIAHFEMLMKNKESEVSSMHRNISLLYEACRRSILELENRRAKMVEKSGVGLTLPSWVHGEGQASFNGDVIRTVADSMLITVKGLSDILEEVVEEKKRELSATILDFQRELQEKDVQQNRICAELVSQIREAEAVAKKFSVELDSANVQVEELESQIKEMENHRKLSELRMNEMKRLETLTKEYDQKIKSLTDSLTAKDQEIEGLMQALDEEESQMESLQGRNQELEQIVQQNNLALENLEASRAKALTKLSTTLGRFDELHNLSENLLAEIENLQSQLQERDSDISFLRQEVARCTNDALAKQESYKKVSTDLHEVQTWMDMIVLRFGGNKFHADAQNSSQIHSYIKYLDKQIPSVISELEDLRVSAQKKDALLNIEKGRVNELSQRAEVLEISLREKESQIESSGGAKDSGQHPDSLEVESMINKRSTLGSIAPHVRGGRRVNSDQIAIAIDTEHDNIALDDEDDDKAHGFKSLTTSKIIPRASRPIADRIDGLWVAIERLLMRQPTLRLGLILYWFVLHALLAASI